ncbi:phenylalanyl-tRNA synthetase beta chain [Deinobacterium chartae]|uniref:Phenylalanine--tRNA ligase beta subunit n=1 Tax=Deinobacterium chartae TaxID=521158 RepID=A0A841I2Q7_9DEIO|nr:phenylalanine--tRNA ligase subunit beta [Deinobacterium chartae]MBB6099346.1 phenylalanyl-tRNA synthetase beta chain [Deinobacterium chartae]
MLIAYSWLKELLPDLPAPHDLEPVLARMGLPLEEIMEIPAAPQGVLYGEVERCVPLEGTELRVLTVRVGQSEPITVATGAPNARAGVGVAIAPPGTVIEGQTLGVREMQGVSSWGMACSPKELGIGEYAGGLLLLPSGSAEPGTPLSELWPAETVLDVEVTPNRADVLSALGLARDLAAFLRLELREPGPGLAPEPGRANADVILEHPAADRFVARSASGLENGPSPLWIQRRLLAAGLRPINVAVDVSNYVMLELGQPTAMYDARDLAGRRLAASPARQGETVIGLDGEEYVLEEGDVVIRGDEDRIVGIAGILGAQHGSVRDDTRDLILEAAHFDPVKLRMTARRLGLATDAVYRYERGVDPELAPRAADRIMELLRQAGARIDPGATDAGRPAPAKVLSLAPDYARRLLGMHIPDDEMRGILERLGARVSLEEGTLQVTPPSWRVDLHLPEDLIEEVARLHGYESLPETLPVLRVAADNEALVRAARMRRDLKRAFAGLGFQEVVNYSFTSDEEARAARAELPGVRLRNPLTADRTALRTALYPGLLRTSHVNAAEKRLLIFELGRIFPAAGETEAFGALMRGPLAPAGWSSALEGGFYAFKSLLEAAAQALGAELSVRAYPDRAQVPAHLHPGIAGRVFWNGQEAGWIGELHPAVAAATAARERIYLLEMHLPLAAREWTFQDPSRAPASLRDLAIIAPLEVSYGEMIDLLRQEGGELLESAEAFDVYRGTPIPEGQRSVAIRLTFRGKRTLQDADVDPVFAHLRERVKAAGWSIREAQ